MTLYLKALRAGRMGTHTDFTWPEPGVWVEVEGDAAEVGVSRSRDPEAETHRRERPVNVLRVPMHPLSDDGPVARVVGWALSRLIDVLLLPVVIWDDIQQAMADDPYESED